MVGRIPVLAVVAALGATPALAHPHVFIDTGIEVMFDAEGHASAVRITWTYDEFYTLSILTDRGMDPDGDGALPPKEQADIAGFDMHWDPGYPGDTYALLDGKPLDLGPPSDWTAVYQDGKLITTHLRTLAAKPLIAETPLVIQSYDPSFYVAYTIDPNPVLTGRSDCAAQVFEPDTQAADKILQAALDEYAGSSDVEADFPAVGAAYAEEVRVTCAARS